MLSEEDKLDMVQAICTIMCKAEEEGTQSSWIQDGQTWHLSYWVSG
jgi:hypothetical protein